MAVAFAAKAVGAVAAFERIVGAFIKTFRMQRKGKFPDNKNNDRTGTKAPGEETGNKNQRRKHHHVVPVENAAGGAAAVFHKPNAERAPEKYTDKVAYIKSNGDEKQKISADDSGEIKDTDNGAKRKPGKTDFDGVAVAFFDVFHKILDAADVFDFRRNKILKAEFGGTYGKKFSAGEDLEKHIAHPYKPENMENGKFFEEVPSAHDVILTRSKNKKKCGKYQRSAAEKEFEFIYFSEFGNNSFNGKHR